ncbi:MAG: error-prone DNA polymerase [Kordiimonadales bacterium]|nr:MAG: error-prone DNA polymerase [Kordiimonadales bacterium]
METLPTYAELEVTSNYSFLRGASHPDELLVMAAVRGLSAMAITDHNTLVGIVRGHVAAEKGEIQYIPACRLDLLCGLSLLAYPTDREAYAQLTRMLTTGNRKAPKGECHLNLEQVSYYADGLIFALLPESVEGDLTEVLNTLKAELNTQLYLRLKCPYTGQDRRDNAALAAHAEAASIPLLATGSVRYHAPERRELADVMTCIRNHTTIEEAGYFLEANAERFIKPPEEMARLFSDHPDAVSNTLVIAKACTFSLNELRYNYPNEPVPPEMSPQAYLEKRAQAGLIERYPEGIPAHIQATLEKEFRLIEAKTYAPYFLTVYDIVVFARGRGILCQGRGSAANSLVCYALRITDVDPREVDLLFERFVSDARDEPPDIDVDFEHQRREEVIQYIYERYGRHRAGLTATLITYRAKSAIRDVGKVMGLSEDTITALSSTVWGSYGKEIPDEQVREAGFNPDDRRFRQTLELAHELMGFPRHLSQHVGGFVLTESPLHDIVPIQNAAMEDRTVIEWNKDDLDALGILKVDILALGMLTCLRKCFDLLRSHYGKRLALADVPATDGPTYKMIQKADTVGVFQIESRAQMSMLPRLKPKIFYDLIVQVAIVRPGPIQGNMVHPYLRRRQGKEEVEYPSPSPEFGPPDELRKVLEKTYGVPLFQEQAMKIAMVAANFTGEEADRLRRSMASFKNVGTVHTMKERFISGMTQRGYQEDFAERCFKQIEGFADYGFPESHAAAFALLAYVSAWMKCHYPAVFACGLLNSQPMGFYASAQIIRDAVEHGVDVRAVDVNHSSWDALLEPCPKTGWALRLGTRQIKGLREAEMDKMAQLQANRFSSVEDLHRRSRLPVPQLQKLAEADAFRSCGLDRRQALWQVRGLTDAPDLPLFTHAFEPEHAEETQPNLPVMPLAEHVVEDYQTLRFSLKAHPLSFLRDRYSKRGILRCSDLAERKNGDKVSAAGLVLVRQRPGSAKGVVFMTVEDESGIANIVVWSKVFDSSRATLMSARLMIIHGELQREDGVTHLVAHKLEDGSHDLQRLADGTLDEEDPPISKRRPQARQRHPRHTRALVPVSRDFH